MTSRMRRFESTKNGHKWTDVDSYGRKEGSGESNLLMRAGVLRFLEDLEPSNVYSVEFTGVTAYVYYREA